MQCHIQVYHISIKANAEEESHSPFTWKDACVRPRTPCLVTLTTCTVHQEYGTSLLALVALRVDHSASELTAAQAERGVTARGSTCAILTGFEGLRNERLFITSM